MGQPALRAVGGKLKARASIKTATLVGCPFESSTAFNDVEKLVLRYAAAMTHTPIVVSNALFDALRQHLDERPR